MGGAFKSCSADEDPRFDGLVDHALLCGLGCEEAFDWAKRQLRSKPAPPEPTLLLNFPPLSEVSGAAGGDQR